MWAVPVLGPILWTGADNPSFTEGLDPGAGLAVRGALLACLALIEHMRGQGGWSRPRPSGWLRGVLQRRIGMWAYVLLISPLDPLSGAVAALTLGLLARRCGLAAAVIAHGGWALAPASWFQVQPPVAVLCAGLAVALAAAPDLSGRLRALVSGPRSPGKKR